MLFTHKLVSNIHISPIWESWYISLWCYKEIKRNRNELKKIIEQLVKIEQDLDNINIELNNKEISSDYEKLGFIKNKQNQLETEYLTLWKKRTFG